MSRRTPEPSELAATTASEEPIRLIQRAILAPALTVLAHPDASRVGERVRLPELRRRGGAVGVSRLAPGFTHPGRHDPAPLADRRLSRKPTQLVGSADGIDVLPAEGSTLHLDGVAFSTPRRVGTGALARGVMIELSRRVAVLLHEVGPEREPDDPGALLGASDGIRRVRDLIRRLAELDIPVLFRGESGTGKELAAQAVHTLGRRRDAPFVAVNMAALPPSTASAALFGHSRGAFTGARDAHRGHFRSASGGTLFLDEVGATPLPVQAMLLRALETSEIQPLGSDRVEKVEVRVVAATDANLEAGVSTGLFLMPLLQRLAPHPIVLPPLRARRDDIARLAVHFLTSEGAELEWLDAPAMRALVGYAWPGNVRELRHLCQRLALADVAERAEVLAGLGDQAAGDTGSVADGRGVAVPAAPAASEPVATAPTDIDDDLLLETLEACAFSPKRAAERLGISRTTLYSLIRASGAVRVAEDIPDDEIREALDEADGDLEACAARLKVSKRALMRRARLLGPGPAEG